MIGTLSQQNPTGWQWKEEYEADGRDYKLDQVLGTPTAQELKEVPVEVNLHKELKHTYVQSPYSSCTAASLTHIHLIQNILEFANNNIEMNWKDLREKMWHDLSNPKEGWDYLEHALKTLCKQWLKWSSTTWQPMDFNADSYAYHTCWNAKQIMKWYLSKWHPLYMAFRWNTQVYREMKIWLVETVQWDWTWWHAVAATWYDEEYIYFTNSWTPRWSTLSWFKMTWITLFDSIKYNQCAWRFWILYDHKDVDNALFFDYAPDINSEEYEAVKWMKDNEYMKWYKWKFMPNEKLTREQFCLVMYRMRESFNASWQTQTTTKSSKKKKSK